MGGQASTGFHLLWTGAAQDRWRAADAAAEMFSVGGQSGELLTDVGAVATLTVVGGIWLGASVRDVVCATVVATTLVVWNSSFVRGRRAPSSAHQPLVSDEPTRHVGGDSRALGAAQAQLIERLVELGTHPVILDLLTAAVREGRWYDSVEGLEAYVGADSFETIVEEVQTLGLDVNQAKSFVRRMQRGLGHGGLAMVRGSHPGSAPLSLL